ncbi:DUF3549 family protein [Echinimonas agarilytica]|uniref:DUF3549 family protein n=1 Tax=Echinimonas agarilytica TaxID=1215918 RepID=A0AA41W5I4_9GAMM|nr:DUF3549 family protein [Echinimonas agarilytica]MCM2679116.1 DUF3549 family protein [Echinimonas agarilytica]
MSTIAEVLTLGGCQFKVFELGRRVFKISRDDFVAFEQGAKAYPSPIQGHACFAIVFSKPEMAQTPYLWLLKFPLDEQNKLLFGARDDFLRMVIEALGEDLANSDSNTEALNNHPYSLKPSDEKLAVLNAKIRNDLHQPASIYFESAYQYFCQQPTAEGWQTLGIQGIADVGERLCESTIKTELAARLAELPVPAFNALSQVLEHALLPAVVVESLLRFGADKRDPFWIRAISGAPQNVLIGELTQTLNSAPSIDHVITVGARWWSVLNTPERVLEYLESVVRLTNNFQVFAALVADLNGLPQCRPACLSALRLPHRSEQLSIAIGQLFHTNRS